MKIPKWWHSFYERLILVCGGLVCLLGLAGALHHNTAPCFFLSGFSLLLIARERMRKLVVSCGVAILVLSGLSLFHLGIHMAPNSALCFLLVASAFLLMVSAPQAAALRVLAYLASLTMASALLFAFGYVGGVVRSYRLVHLEPMTLPSAAGFICLALGIFAFVREQERKRGVRGLGCLPVPIVFGSLTLVAFLWLAFAAHERHRIEELSETRLMAFKQSLRGSLNEEVSALARLLHAEKMPGEAEIDLFQGDFPQYRAVGWSEGVGRYHWVMREAGLDLSPSGPLGEALSILLQKAGEKRDLVILPWVSRPARSLLLVAIPHPSADGQAPLVIGVLDARQLFESALPDYILADFALTVYEDSSTLRESFGTVTEVMPDHARAGLFSLYSLEWRVELQPKTGFLRRERSALPGVILIAGLLVVALLAAVFRLAEAAFKRAAQAEEAYEDLKKASAEREKAERVLEETQAQLRQAMKMEAVGRLAGGVAHDFNSFLTAINGFSEIALQKLQGNELVRSYLNEIRKAGEEAAGVTHQLLAFSRKQVLELKVLDLNESVEKMRNLLRHLLSEGIMLDLELSPNLGLVRVDRNQLEQVIMNLVVNARDAIGTQGTISIGTSRVCVDELARSKLAAPVTMKVGEYVKLTVADSGCGMPPEVISHLFEPFFTTKETGKGTGLGLAMVYGIIKQSEGFVFVDSAPRQGTKFSIYLPCIDDTGSSRNVGADAPASIPSSPGARTILVVEDNESVRKLTCESLRMHGYTVLEAANGEDALCLAEIQSMHLDLMLTDLVMPHMGGVELADRIHPLRPRMPVLFMTGFADDPPARPGVKILHKPFTQAILLQLVAEALGRKDKPTSKEAA